jgi:protein-tyrosine-phosphatase
MGGIRLNILFVCTGNTCRSPMAEALFKNMIKDGEFEVRSAGLAAIDGQPASQHVTEVLKKRDIAHTHSAKMLDQELIQWADLILTMTFAHKMGILNSYKESHGKVFTLKEYVTEEDELESEEMLNWDIADPFGGDYELYQACADEIEASLQKLIKKLHKA